MFCGTIPSCFWRASVSSRELLPALVELALVLVGPFRRHVVRCVAAASGVEQEPGLFRILGPNRVQPLDGLVGDVVGEVVLLAILALGHAERGVVLGDDRIVLAGRTGQEAPPVIEAPRFRPMVERARGTLHVVRSEMPLAEPAGDVTVLLQDPRERRAAPGLGGGVAGERAGILGDRTKAHPVLVPSGQKRRTGRRAHRRDVEAVVGQAHLRHARQVGRANRAAEGVRSTEAGVVDDDQQDVRRTVRRFRSGDHRPVGDRVTQRASGGSAELSVGDRERGAVGTEASAPRSACPTRRGSVLRTAPGKCEQRGGSPERNRPFPIRQQNRFIELPPSWKINGSFLSGLSASLLGVIWVLCGCAGTGSRPHRRKVGGGRSLRMPS